MENTEIQSILQLLGERLPSTFPLVLVGGSALALPGSPRPTIDIDFVGDDVKPNKLHQAIMQIGTGPAYSEDYGYGWWIARPDEEPTFSAEGRGGQRVLVYPAMNMVLVVTGSGFELDDVGGYLIAAIGEDSPLPANPAGVADLRAALEEVAQPPAAQSVPPMSDVARAISGHTYVFEDNPYRLASLRMQFDESAEATIHMTYFGGLADRLGAVGLDGQYRFFEIEDSPDEKFLVGLRGAWSDPQTFALDYNQVASPNALMLSLHFEAGRVIIEGPGVDWEGAVTIEGWQQ